MAFGKKIRQIRQDELGWSIKKAVEQINQYLPNNETISHKTLYSWEYGNTEPKFSYGIGLCKAYGIDDVLGLFSETNMICDLLNENGKQRLQEYRELLLNSPKFRVSQDAESNHESVARLLPLYDIAASAGTGQFLDSSDYTTVEVPEFVPLCANFGVRIAGDSMEPKIHDKGIVWVQQKQTLEDGEIGVFYLDGNVLCKQLSSTENGVSLVSLNSAYKPIHLYEDCEFRVFGKVVG